MRLLKRIRMPWCYIMQIRKELIEKAIEDFHLKFYPEVIVEYIGSSKEGYLAFYFTGHFCVSCGLYDFFDDFRDVLQQYLNTEYVVEEYLPINHGYVAWVVIYAPKSITRKTIEKKRRFLILDPESSKITEEVEVSTEC